MNLSEFFEDHPEVAAVGHDCQGRPIALIGTLPSGPPIRKMRRGEPCWFWYGLESVIEISPSSLPEGFPDQDYKGESLKFRSPT